MLDQFEKVWDMLVGTWPGVLFCICTMWYLYITLHDLHPGAYVYNWRIFLIWFVVLLSNSQMTLQPAADLSYRFCVSLCESATEISLWNTCPSLTEEYLTLQMEICILLINVYISSSKGQHLCFLSTTPNIKPISFVANSYLWKKYELWWQILWNLTYFSSTK